MKRHLLSAPLSTFCHSFQSRTGSSHLTDTMDMTEEGSRAGKVALDGKVKGLKLDAFPGVVQRRCDGCEPRGSGHKVPLVPEQWCFGESQAVLGDAEAHQSPGSQRTLLTKPWRWSQATTNPLKSLCLQKSQPKWTPGCLTSAIGAERVPCTVGCPSQALCSSSSPSLLQRSQLSEDLEQL